MALSRTQRLGVGALILVWAGLLFGGLVFGTPIDSLMNRMPDWTDLFSSAVLVVLAWVLTSLTRSRALVPWIGLGMTCGFLGDLLLGKVIPFPDPLIGGIGAFGLGHLMYIIGLLRYSNEHGPIPAKKRWGSLVFMWIIGFVSWYLLVFDGGPATVLRLAALAYALLLATTGGVALGLALQTRRFTSVAIGAFLFLSSDMIIAAERFSNITFSHNHDIIWLTYGPAQLLIISSLYLALPAQQAFQE